MTCSLKVPATFGEVPDAIYCPVVQFHEIFVTKIMNQFIIIVEAAKIS